MSMRMIGLTLSMSSKTTYAKIQDSIICWLIVNEPVDSDFILSYTT